ncbi:hypothetical protein L9F63_008200, partial [Diploptera punctata]
MSAPAGNEDDPGVSRGKQKLNTVTLSEKNISALHSSKSFNVFILSPSQLNDLGLVTKVKNGKPVIVHENKESSTAQNSNFTIEMSKVIPQSSDQIENKSGFAGISLKSSQALKVAVGKQFSKKLKLQNEVENSK